MALTCAGFDQFDMGPAQTVAACVAPHIAGLEDHQILEEQFLMFVIAALERLRLNPGTFPNLNTMPACDANDALRAVSCKMITNTLSYPITVPQMQSIIAWQLNEALCT